MTSSLYCSENQARISLAPRIGKHIDVRSLRLELNYFAMYPITRNPVLKATKPMGRAQTSASSGEMSPCVPHSASRQSRKQKYDHGKHVKSLLRRKSTFAAHDEANQTKLNYL
jgi:hypothetical protein